MKRFIANIVRKALGKEHRSFIEKLVVTFYYLFSGFLNLLGKIFLRVKNPIIAKNYLRARSVSRNLIKGRLNFVSIDELVLWTYEWLKSFSDDYDVIVGLPRSGLFVANLVSLKLGKPLSTPDNFCKDIYWHSNDIEKPIKAKKILLVDDTIRSGKTLRNAFDNLKEKDENLSIVKAALIVSEDSKDKVDLYFKTIPIPRLFEWNLMHFKTGKLGADLDGVICENCPPKVDLDEIAYKNWIRSAKPYLIPSFEIDVIISARLEKYRKETEEWLKTHGVKYRKLILWDIQQKAQRKGSHAVYKSKQLLIEKPDLFWESSLQEANTISTTTNIPTICIDEMILFN